MSSRSFSLKPFEKTDSEPNVKITGTVGRRSNTFSITYVLLCPLSELAVPASEDKPTRKDGLWEETCLEFFIGVKESNRYWEFNLSPAGHWNVYRFTSYRQDMQEESAFISLPFSVKSEPDALGLSLELGLDEIISVEQSLEVAVSAVIKTVDGTMTHWALAHPGPQPDFHRRDCFIIEL